MKIGDPIGRGTRSTVHLCGPGVVAKVPLPTTPDHWIRSEALYTEAVRTAGAPAPTLIDVVEHEGRVVGIYQQIVGPSMWDMIIESPSQAAHHGRELAELHRRIVSLRAPLTVPRQSDRLAGKIRRAAAMTDPEVASALDLLPDGWTATDLCHGDLHPGNVILGVDGPVVIDWFDACRGRAVADIARSSLLIGAGGATAGSVPHLPGATPEMLEDLHGAYIDGMMSALGGAAADLAVWCRIEAAARLAEGLWVDELLAIWRQTDASAVAAR